MPLVSWLTAAAAMGAAAEEKGGGEMRERLAAGNKTAVGGGIGGRLEFGYKQWGGMGWEEEALAHLTREDGRCRSSEEEHARGSW